MSHSWNVHSLSFRVKMLQFKAGFLFFLRTVIALEEVTIVPWLIKQKCRSFFYPAILQTSNLQSAACAIKRYPSLSDSLFHLETNCIFHLGLSLLLHSGVKLQWSETIKFQWKVFDAWHRNVQFVTMFMSHQPAGIMPLSACFVDNSSYWYSSQKSRFLFRSSFF